MIDYYVKEGKIFYTSTAEVSPKQIRLEMDNLIKEKEKREEWIKENREKMNQLRKANEGYALEIKDFDASIANAKKVLQQVDSNTEGNSQCQ